MDKEYSAYSLMLDRTSRRVKQYAQSKFKELGFGVTVDQWVVMKQLYVKGNLSQTEIAELVFKDMPTLTRIIDLLCNKELAVRTPFENDRRKFSVSLTDKGHEKVKLMWEPVNEIRQKAWSGLSEEDFDKFQFILNKIYDNLQY